MKRILVVDDELHFLFPIIKAMKNEKYEVTECENAHKAMTHISNICYDCIIVDYSMPEMDGLELVKWIRSHSNKKISETPILLLSGWEETVLVTEAYKVGISLFRTKTGLFDKPQDIFEAIETATNMNTVHRLHNRLAVAFKRNIDND